MKLALTLIIFLSSSLAAAVTDAEFKTLKQIVASQQVRISTLEKQLEWKATKPVVKIDSWSNGGYKLQSWEQTVSEYRISKSNGKTWLQWRLAGRVKFNAGQPCCGMSFNVPEDLQKLRINGNHTYGVGTLDGKGSTAKVAFIKAEPPATGHHIGQLQFAGKYESLDFPLNQWINLTFETKVLLFD